MRHGLKQTIVKQEAIVFPVLFILLNISAEFELLTIRLVRATEDLAIILVSNIFSLISERTLNELVDVVDI